MAVAATVGLARLAVAQVAPAAPAAGAPNDLAQRVQAQAQQDITVLNSGRTQPERDEAARRLVSRQSPELKEEIVRALNVRPIPAAPAPSTPLAAARAAADDLNPVKRYVAPLVNLLGVDRVHSEAAAAALISIRDPDGQAALIRFVSDNTRDRGIRQAAILKMGASADKQIAIELVGLVQKLRTTDPPISNAAADALIQMTAASENGADPVAWARWLESNRKTPPDEFRADLLERRRKRLAGENLTDVDSLVARLVQLTDEKARPEAIRRVLDSTDPRLRLAGVRLVYQNFLGSGLRVEGSLVRLREMISDPSPDVRAGVARTIQGINDQPALTPLLTQLTVEPDAAVRVAIASALVPINDARAAPALIRLLKDESLRVQVTAAESLSKLGPVLRADPAISAQVSAALLQIINGPPLPPHNRDNDLKAACVEALVQLRNPKHLQLFTGLLNANQSVRTRRAALAGLSELRDVNSGNVVINWLRGEPDAEVRLAALGALRTVGTFALDEAIFDYTQSKVVEPDAGNRKAAWDTFVVLAAGGSKERLAMWAERFLRDGQFDRRIPVLQEILKKQLAGNEAQAAAITREQIGESFMKLQPPQPAAAIPYYRDALQYWQANQGGQQVIMTLTKSLLEAMLGARQYTEAVNFAGGVLAQNGESEISNDVMATLTINAERLMKDRQPREAERLAQEALKLKNLTPRFKDRLQTTIEQSKAAPGI